MHCPHKMCGICVDCARTASIFPDPWPELLSDIINTCMRSIGSVGCSEPGMAMSQLSFTYVSHMVYGVPENWEAMMCTM